MKKLLLLPLKLLSFIFGQFSWSPPRWLVASFSFFKKHIKITLGLICAVMIAAGITQYIQSLPKPISTKAEFSEISLRQKQVFGDGTVTTVYHSYQKHRGQPVLIMK